MSKAHNYKVVYVIYEETNQIFEWISTDYVARGPQRIEAIAFLIDSTDDYIVISDAVNTENSGYSNAKSISWGSIIEIYDIELYEEA